jgi:putative RNA 2'-phosphotransferase
MSALLRHIPQEAGLKLDNEGWVSVHELVRAIRERWRNRELYQWVRPEHVVAVALLDPKGRFQLSPDKRLIRAAYGHSINVQLKYKPLRAEEAPKILFHGTVRSKLPSILREGLKPMKRIAVHLTDRLEDAIETAKRHGRDVVVLSIDSECLYSQGIHLVKAGKTVYLASRVPPECIKILK